MTEPGEPRSSERTTPLSEQQVAAIRALDRVDAQAQRLSLTIRHDDSVRVVPLAEGRRVLVGRSAPAEIAINDQSLSRQHAAVELIDGRVWIEDLGSTNGTWVDGLRVERIQVPPGTELMLGGVVASVDLLGAAGRGRGGLVSHDRFAGELAAEVARAREYGRSVALLMVRGPRQAGASLGRWLPQVQQRLRPFDTAALYSGDTAELLLPELGPEQARELAASLAGPEGRLHLGLAAYPHHAGSAEELLEVARDSLQRARGDGTIAIPEALSAGARALVPGEPSGGPVIASPAMEHVFRMAQRLASSTIPVLVVGETGTGKELVALAIHGGGKRKGRPLICVNCGALPSQLVESTLFGHEKGAFTGASQQAQGVFEAADGGTVFLDEIGELPAAAQAALLRVLETKRVARVGSTREVEVDVRVVAATHRDLEQMSTTGGFRSDLLYRLNAMVIEIPPLRERRVEIEPLARRFVTLANEANGCAVTSIAEDAMDLLATHSWPGNVRELRNAIERAVVIAEGATVTIDDLPRPLAQLAHQRRVSGPAPLAGAAPEGGVGGETDERWPDDIDLRAELDRFESRVLRVFLERAGGDRKEAARHLGLPYRTLSHKMMVLGLGNEP
jgi:DNA-binding NtrC family response regulator/pSer/pThr/pTyr-binding forkhead associated (FHA) protein